ncbi:hypothetical protein KP509_31G038400 [Ceratopteris richardii]|uniref:Uncharacterized protein n=1 Tax=Ceratopteris richardii TaxID=49495 RepID=A0A8T2QYR0_CERRI|nr:hypothetical protein KP509_31G038400 [Ceratopteris richardii]
MCALDIHGLHKGEKKELIFGSKFNRGYTTLTTHDSQHFMRYLTKSSAKMHPGSERALNHHCTCVLVDALLEVHPQLPSLDQRVPCIKLRVHTIYKHMIVNKPRRKTRLVIPDFMFQTRES